MFFAPFIQDGGLRSRHQGRKLVCFIRVATQKHISIPPTFCKAESPTDWTIRNEPYLSANNFVIFLMQTRRNTLKFSSVS
jgi:hypothetical protein